MKKNVKILIGIVVLVAVLYGGRNIMRGGHDVDSSDVAGAVKMESFTGQVVRSFEGENKLDYSVDLPENAQTKEEMEGALIHVVNEEAPYLSMYMSFEGARGYTPLEYIDNVITPKVPVIEITSTSTIGGYEWQGAESPASEWHVASVAGGKWLVVVENKKVVHDLVVKTIESLKAN